MIVALGGKKYILHPGRVKSVSDGDTHFIGFTSLVRCYRLDPRECLDARSPVVAVMRPEVRDSFIHLGPRRRGDYEQHLAYVIEQHESRHS